MRRVVHKSQPSFNLPSNPLLIVLSGPSGAGKDAVLARMKELDFPLVYIITLTTRPRRPNERDGVDYHFISMEKFQDMLQKNGLLEWAKVYGNCYGVPREAVKEALARGQDVIVKVDVQGAATIKKILPQAIFVFLVPPAMGELATRLEQRHTESPADLALRLKTAEEEMSRLSLFDYVVVNRWQEIDRAVADIKAIITAEKCRVIQRKIAL